MRATSKIVGRDGRPRASAVGVSGGRDTASGAAVTAPDAVPGLGFPRLGFPRPRRGRTSTSMAAAYPSRMTLQALAKMWYESLIGAAQCRGCSGECIHITIGGVG